LLKSAVGYAAIERKVDTLTEADFIGVLQKEIKKRREAMEQFEKGGRTDLATKEQGEIQVMEAFLPQQLSAEELEALVRSVIAETGATSRKDMGAVMKAVQARAAGRAEGRAISAVVGRLLP
jgi:uncharacterized protein YqeY